MFSEHIYVNVFWLKFIDREGHKMHAIKLVGHKRKLKDVRYEIAALQTF